MKETQKPALWAYFLQDCYLELEACALGTLPSEMGAFHNCGPASVLGYLSPA